MIWVEFEKERVAQNSWDIYIWDSGHVCKSPL